MILRHLGRWPVRTALTTTGIAMAMAVLVFSLQFLDSIELLMDAQFFRGQRQDATIAFADARSLTALAGVAHLPGVLAVEPFRGVPVRLGFGPRSRREVITGMRADSRLGLLLDTAGRQVILPARGLVLSTKLADLLGAGRGDVVRVEVLDGKRPVLELPVTGLVETWLGTPAYMDLDALAAALREAPTASGAWATLDSAAASRLYQRLTEVPEVAGLVLRGTLVASFRATLAKSMHIVLSFYVMFGAFLTFGVVYNGARIALSERRHELATLRVLGFTRGEVSYILLGELAAQTIAALPMGAGFGWGLAHMLAASFDTEQFRMPVSVSAATMGQAALVVVVSAVLSGLLVQRKIRGLDLVAVLKARE